MTLSFNNTDRIFSIKNEQQFNEIALEIFHYQYHQNIVYHNFIEYLGKDINTINHYHQIPFLPIEFFKKHKIICGEKDIQAEFTSSGTTGLNTSTHYIIDTELYKKSFLHTFSLFYGDISNYIILALLPSYLERKGSSLVFMADELIRLSCHEKSGFYLYDFKALNDTLEYCSTQNKKTILLGVSYALLDFCEQFPQKNTELIIMETGGMKGKRTELTKEELHQALKKGFLVNSVNSEYGMTELLSQVYSFGEGIYYTPPWMKVIIRDSEDPLSLTETGKNGGINIIDLANLHSCSFIATQDLGKSNADGSFEIIGRFDASDIRGCNLMVV